MDRNGPSINYDRTARATPIEPILASETVASALDQCYERSQSLMTLVYRIAEALDVSAPSCGSSGCNESVSRNTVDRVCDRVNGLRAQIAEAEVLLHEVTRQVERLR